MHCIFVTFFFNDTATTEIYTLSLHDALPIYATTTNGPLVVRTVDDALRAAIELHDLPAPDDANTPAGGGCPVPPGRSIDRKSTRLNSSHVEISYAVFCLKKKKKKTSTSMRTA